MGTKFHDRLVSRDANAAQDMVDTVANSRLYVDAKAERMFGPYLYKTSDEYNGHVKLVDDTARFAVFHPWSRGYMFLTGPIPPRILRRVKTITVYQWNKVYPHDTEFDVSALESFVPVSTKEIAGTSHEKITITIYARRK